jgi:calcium binding protein 39
MTDSNFGSSAKPSTNAFEWLAGGLFFGPGKQAKGGTIKSIDSCKDVQILLEGVNESLQEVITTASKSAGSSAAAPPVTVAAPAAAAETGSDAPAAAEPTASEFLAARLARLRFLLYDERRISSQQWEMSSSSSFRRNASSAVAAATLQGLTSSDNSNKLQGNNLMPQMLGNLSVLPFESRKVVAHIFNYLLAAGLDGADAALYYAITEGFRDYVYTKCDIFLTIIVNGLGSCHHGATDVALHCGSMYRSFLRHPVLYQQIVGSTERASKYVFPFLDDYVHLPDFDVSSDAMECLRMILIAGSCGVDRVVNPDERAQQTMAELAAEFMTRDYEELFDLRFNPKLLSDTANYMTRRVALQILSTVLLTRSNYNVMVRFVASKLNLILIMKLLRDTSPHITLDAFHVFKVFVANPNKPPEVVTILKDNQVKLCAYLATLHQDKAASDAQFRDEKALIIATIEAL